MKYNPTVGDGFWRPERIESPNIPHYIKHKELNEAIKLTQIGNIFVRKSNYYDGLIYF